MPNFITDYTYRFSNDECDPDFHFWSCLTLLGHVLGKRVWVKHGRFTFFPNLYTLMIGTAGSGKSTARAEAKKLYLELFPDLPTAESIQSREDIVAKMVEQAVFWKLPNEPKLQEYHPYFVMANELAEFISVNPTKMLGFFVDVYDETSYGVGFKKDGEAGLKGQRFPNPHVSILACAQPEWFMANIKTEIFTRGLGRRCILLHRMKTKLNPEPNVPPDSHEGWQRVIAHLTKFGSKDFFGEAVKTEAARRWYNAWHSNPKRFERYDDPMLRTQLLETQHVLLHKIALLFACCRYDFNFLIEEDDYILALKQLHSLERDVAKLMSTTGTNDMAPVAELMVQAVEASGGWMLKGRLLLNFYRHSPNKQRDFESALAFLVDTGQVYVAAVSLPDDKLPGTMLPVKWYVITPLGLEKLKEKGVTVQVIDK